MSCKSVADAALTRSVSKDTTSARRNRWTSVLDIHRGAFTPVLCGEMQYIPPEQKESVARLTPTLLTGQQWPWQVLARADLSNSKQWCPLQADPQGLVPGCWSLAGCDVRGVLLAWGVWVGEPFGRELFCYTPGEKLCSVSSSSRGANSPSNPPNTFFSCREQSQIIFPNSEHHCLFFFCSTDRGRAA